MAAYWSTNVIFLVQVNVLLLVVLLRVRSLIVDPINVEHLFIRKQNFQYLLLAKICSYPVRKFLSPFFMLFCECWFDHMFVWSTAKILTEIR